MSGRCSNYEYALRSYVFGREVSPRLARIVALFEYMYPGLREAVRRGVCPFCGRRLKHGIYIHLTQGPCADELRYCIRRCIEVYQRWRRMLVKSGNRTYKLVERNGKQARELAKGTIDQVFNAYLDYLQRSGELEAIA